MPVQHTRARVKTNITPLSREHAVKTPTKPLTGTRTRPRLEFVRVQCPLWRAPHPHIILSVSTLNTENHADLTPPTATSYTAGPSKALPVLT